MSSSGSDGAAPNVFNTSADAFNQSLSGTGAAYGAFANQLGGPAYTTAQPGQINTGLDAAQAAGGQTVNQNFTAPQAGGANPIYSGYSNYMNPYQQDVVNATSQQMQDVTNNQQMQNAANAMQSGAFGGGRQGIVEAQTNALGQQNIGQMAASLNQQGFNQAMGLSAQDIANQMNQGQFNANQQATNNALNQSSMVTNAANQQQNNQFNAAARTANQQFNTQNQAQNIANAMQTGQFNAGQSDNAAQRALAAASGMGNMAAQGGALAQQGFNMGNTINNAQTAQGSSIQQLQQQLMDLANGQFTGTTGQPTTALNTLLQSLGMNPLSNATTTTGTYKAGTMDYLSLLAGLGESAMTGKIGAKVP